LDESDFLLKPLIGKMWQKKGEQNIVPATLESRKVCCFGAVNIKTLKVDYLMRPRKRSKEFVEFLNYLDKRYPGSKKIIVLDNYVIHRSRYVQEQIKGRDFKFLFLPTYAPELNPMEDIWRVVKNKVCRNYYHKNIERLIKAVSKEFNKRSYEAVVRNKYAA
jgi:transposase